MFGYLKTRSAVGRAVEVLAAGDEVPDEGDGGEADEYDRSVCASAMSQTHV